MTVFVASKRLARRKQGLHWPARSLCLAGPCFAMKKTGRQPPWLTLPSHMASSQRPRDQPRTRAVSQHLKKKRLRHIHRVYERRPQQSLKRRALKLFRLNLHRIPKCRAHLNQSLRAQQPQPNQTRPELGPRSVSLRKRR